MPVLKKGASLVGQKFNLRSKLWKFSKIKTPEGKHSYITLRREYKNAIKKDNNYGWKEFTSNIKYPREVLKLIKSFNNSKNNSLGLLNKSTSAAQDPRSTVQFNPPLFWKTNFFFGGG